MGQGEVLTGREGSGRSRGTQDATGRGVGTGRDGRRGEPESTYPRAELTWRDNIVERNLCFLTSYSS
ncbi:hypothetical protein E2C01_055218 [Portunus trituberculatus]|uniref:Uncharacterized protein n=1 Tax=Portunus trituberculatus TaxID=210409 RepID=A0A5B7GX22_PORTR|nr:hypothetical protein [Portunus trituberculatus]